MSDMDKKMILLDDPGDQQPQRDPLRPVVGTVIDGLVAVIDEDGKFQFATANTFSATVPGDRLYRCRVTIDGEVG